MVRQAASRTACWCRHQRLADGEGIAERWTQIFLGEYSHGLSRRGRRALCDRHVQARGRAGGFGRVEELVPCECMKACGAGYLRGGRQPSSCSPRPMADRAQGRGANKTWASFGSGECSWGPSCLGVIQGKMCARLLRPHLHDALVAEVGSRQAGGTRSGSTAAPQMSLKWMAQGARDKGRCAAALFTDIRGSFPQRASSTGAGQAAHGREGSLRKSATGR